MALALDRHIGRHRHRPERGDVDRDHGDRAVLRSCAFARVRRQQRREIAHIRHAGLDHGGKADAVDFAGGTCRVAAALEIVEPAIPDRGCDGAHIITGIIERARRGVVGEFLGRNEVAPDHVKVVEAKLDRNALHQPLDGEVKLRPAETADQARRHLVGEDDAVGHIHVGNVIRARHRAMHPVERSRHGSAQERPVVLQLIEPQPKNAAGAGDSGLDPGDAIGSRTCGRKVLGAIFDPFHRTPGDLCGDRGKHDIGKHRELDAEAAA